MARYLLTAAAFLNGSLRRAGEIIEFDGQPSKAMRLLDEPTTGVSVKPKPEGKKASPGKDGQPSKADGAGEPPPVVTEPATGGENSPEPPQPQVGG
ncbi:MAG: hypothetical protein RBR34_08545 [Rhodospirillaceae bacterium]|nr:hypothetical protein [Rhodospirillaceae bacterium]